MRRQWRLVRMILAGLLISLAALVFYAWPIGPRWRMAGLEPVGFGLSRGLLWAVDNKNSHRLELLGLNVQTGAREVSHLLDTSSTGQDNPFMSRVMTNLSKNGKTLLCRMNNESFLFDVENQCQRLSKMDSTGIVSTALSPDGKLYALLTPALIRVSECRSGKVIFDSPPPDGMFAPIIMGYPPDRTILFSDDGRFLAVSGEDFSITIIDLAAGVFVGNCPQATFPIFLADNTTLLAIDHALTRNWSHPFRRYSGLPSATSFVQPDWQYLDAKSMKKGMPGIVYGQTILCANSERLLLAFLDNSERLHLPEWIPGVVREKIVHALGWHLRLIVIQSWNSQTCQLQDAFTIKVRGIGWSTLSSDGKLLAIEDGEGLSLWDVPPRRSLACWLVCSGMAALALSLAWPRRMKQSSG